MSSIFGNYYCTLLLSVMIPWKVPRSDFLVNQLNIISFDSDSSWENKKKSAVEESLGFFSVLLGRV